MRPKQFLRKLLFVSPLLAVGLCFQNFTELESNSPPELVFPEAPGPDPRVKYGTSATTPASAAEEFLRTQWMPELKTIEERLQRKLQFRFDQASPTQAEVEMNVVGRGPASISGESGLASPIQVSLVNDRLRFRFTGVDLACDYHVTKDLVSLRSNFSTPSQVQFEHSGREQASRVSWQMSW